MPAEIFRRGCFSDAENTAVKPLGGGDTENPFLRGRVKALPLPPRRGGIKELSIDDFQELKQKASTFRNEHQS